MARLITGARERGTSPSSPRMWLAPFVLAAALAVLASACADSGTDTTATTAVGRAAAKVPAVTSTTEAAASSGTMAVTEPPDTTPATRAIDTSMINPYGRPTTIDVDGVERSFLLFVPLGLDPDEPAPLVFNFHGGAGSGSGQASFSGFNEMAAEVGVVVVYPSGVGGYWDFEDGEGADRPDVHDMDFLTAVLDEVSAEISIDASRTYAIGFSMGTGMANILSCQMPDRIAAIVQVAGFMHMDGPACPDPVPTPVMGIVGEADPITTRGTEHLPFADQPQPLDVESEAWIATNACDPAPEVTEVSAGVTRTHYSCDGDAEVIVYRHPGGHSWPSLLGPLVVTNELIWEFLSRHTT